MLALASSAASFVANSRPAQYALGAVLIVIGFLLWLARHDAAVRKNHNIRIERKARKVQSKIKETLDEKSTKTAIARERAPGGVRASSELSDDARSILFGD